MHDLSPEVVRRGRRARWGRAAFAVAGLAVIACRQTLATVFDLPPAQAPAAAAAGAPLPATPLPDTVRPPIERVRAPDSVSALLPTDHAGNIDWVAALRRGIINPRSALPGRAVPPAGVPVFAFDFLFPGPDTTFDALFPHSAHTEWLECQTCHPRIFAYRGGKISMGEIFQGKFCGECHSKVAFPITTGCERCHRHLAMPPDRAKRDLSLGTIVMTRTVADSGNARGVNTEELPPATFSHAFHRIRFRCKACHMELFEPRAGANRISMNGIDRGEACGRCHNGTTAFAPAIANCQRCHVTPTPAAAAGPD